MVNIDIMQLSTIAGAIMGIVGLGAFLKTVIDKATKPIRDMEKKQDVHNNALRSVLRNSITREHREFVAEGKIGRYALMSAIEMYNQYKELGGNGFIDEIIEELKRLPIDTGIEKH